MSPRLLFVVSFALAACETHPAHDEADHVEGDAHAHDHPSGATAFTRFAGGTELFVQLPPLIVGEPVQPAAHLTRLSDFRPISEGRLIVELSDGGAAAERFEVEGAAAPGVFRPVVRPATSGRRQLVMRYVGGGLEAVHELGEITVHPNAAAARAAGPPAAEPEEGIAFLKEQQWRMDFATAEARRATLRPSFEAHGTLRPRPTGEVLVSAPLAGRLVADGGFARVGQEVAAGDVLAALMPRLSDQGDTAALAQSVSQAEIAMRKAQEDLSRLEGLLAQGAVPERRVTDARFAVEQARRALETARQRQSQARRVGATQGPSAAAIELRAPLAGTVVEVAQPPGAFVEEGARLFRVVDLEALWLEVHVAETHAALVQQPRGAWFEVTGFDGVFEAGPDQVAAVGGVLEEASRTLPLYLEIPNPDRRLRAGLFAEVWVLSADPFEALTVPMSAVLYEAGLPVVYVQHGGERFERRQVRLGVRDGAIVEVLDGLAPGERVVARGAYAVRLAAAGSAVPEHGHEH